MRVSTNLLKQFGNITVNDDEIVKLIQSHIGEVEYSHNLSQDYKDIVIAEVVEKKDHPDADKLAIYQIGCGEKESIQVVAGDKNLNIGDKVAYMKVGSTLPYSLRTEEKPVKIKSVKLRDVTSNGMLGSERELNIGPDHERVLTLPHDAPVGENFSKYYNLDDTIIEIENKALTNRADLFGVLGISRELTAILGNKFESPAWYLNEEADLNPETTCLNIEIINDAEAICPRYTAIVLDQIKVKESPIWLKSILIKCNIRPVNNIVDITNYISLLTSQPLHAFDFDKLLSHDPNSKNSVSINIRMARAEEKMLGLDDKLYNLDEKTMVIADSTNPIAIAGIIGGKDTEVDYNTNRIVLESANFNKTSIRRTSMRLGIFTEAATRFKHDLDPNQCRAVLVKAVDLIKEDSTETEVASKIIDIYHEQLKLETIQIDPDNLNRILGTEISTEEISSLLTNLEFQVREKKLKEKIGGKRKYLYVTPPNWRRDINIKEDIYEDIGRIYGFNNIKIELPSKKIQPPSPNRIVEIKKEVREVLSNSGANEMVSYSFVDDNSFRNCNLDNNLAYKIKNALSPELSLMRTCILQSLLVKAQENIQRGESIFSIYEMNIAHLNNYIHEDKLPIEHWYLSLLLTDLNSKESTSAFYVVKKYLEKLLKAMGIFDVQYDLVADSSEIDHPPYIRNLLGVFDPNRSAILSVAGVSLGIIGEINREVKENFKLPAFTAALEINLDELVKIKKGSRKYKGQSVYPPFTQDLCFEMMSDIKYEQIKNEITHILEKKKLSDSLECVDIYQDSSSTDKKRITIRITASDYNKTLNEEEIKNIIKEITEKVEEKYKAVLI